MHLDHKIPWNTAATHVTYIKNNPQFTPRRTDLFTRSKPSESTDLNHFRRTLIRTIREFSTTEESKPLKCIPLDNLLSDDLLSYPEQHFNLGSHTTNSALNNPLSSQHRNIQYWIDRAGTPPTSYVSGDGDLADAVKMLIIIAGSAKKGDEKSKEMSREAISVLLTLSRHPQVPLHTLASIHWGHAFGVELVADTALTVYILINLMDRVVSNKRDDNEASVLETRTFQYWAGNALANYDYPAQNIPHRRFWTGLGVTEEWVYQQRGREGLPTVGGTDPLKGETEDIRSGLQQYLKTCFAILYVYDMLLREWYGSEAADEKWEYRIGCLFESWGCRL
ncbi:hypothetical protein BO94DRAFT_536866 [Aspergillus sclerotioniger CBS 115572]|uniref:Uncharacterized protein n=1 Tax=Aspergillus sclerotioniger CBS 115572 TaxID=1450535 RepID=A0A317W4Q9_9EURO|nr:hypothetical protein BO94DRAFT_536866 [Aspergillus sclerotioniger CBS 115572]PWY81606.1 hypothetical protein BO94DRAFT_536866 [Aspergillus sclerotioniger CBS 115572]